MAVRPRTMSFDFPKFYDSLISNITDEIIKTSLKNLIRDIEKLHSELASIINANKSAITFVSQDDEPSPAVNEIFLWHDADAASGNPTHYLIAFDGTDTVTFPESYAREISWSFASPSGSTGTFYFGGFYEFETTDDDFSPSVTLGHTNEPHGAHIFVVLGATAVDEITISVVGTSFSDTAVRIPSDTETITIPNAAAVDSFYQTDKKFIGQVTIETTAGTAKTCNYGFCKYWNNHDTDFIITGLDMTMLAGANDSGFDVCIRHHKSSEWTFNSGAAPTPPDPIIRLQTDYVNEYELENGSYGSWHRDGDGFLVAGSNSEGTIWEITTTANKAVELGNILMRIIV